MTIGDLCTLNSDSHYDSIEIWARGRVVLVESLMDSVHYAWYGWQIETFYAVSKWNESIKYVVSLVK